MKTTLIFSTLFSLAIAKPLESRWAESSANCQTFYADVTAEAANVDLESVIGGPPANQQVLTQALFDTFKTGSTVMQDIAAAPKRNVSGTYSLWFEYCQPKQGEPKGLFQTHHGIIGNAGYWNAQIDGKTDNSFVESAAAAGWATLSYDRLGVGRSAHPDGIQVVQINYEIAQSIAIANAIRDGSVGNGVPTFSTIVGVGHSYGSALLVGVASAGPETFDQIVLTGYSNNATTGALGLAGFEQTIASVAYPDRFDYGGDYVITPSVSIDQKSFFHYPNYTQNALDLFTTTKGENTLGQSNSIAGVIQLDRSGYNKPTFVITGMNDGPFCAGDCDVTSLGGNSTQLDTTKDLFPAVADGDFETFIVPDTAHGINFHTTAYDAYQQIINFVVNHS